MTLEKQGAWSIWTAALLMIFTIILHPVGGNIDHLLQIKRLIIITHSLAMLAIPLLCFAFFRIGTILGMNKMYVGLGLVFNYFGLLGVLLAALMNGLVGPFFLNQINSPSADDPNGHSMILKFGWSINQAFDYLFMVSSSIGMLCWSIAIVRHSDWKNWLGYLGIITFGGMAMLLINGFAMTDVNSLRIFVSTWLVWLLSLAISVFKRASGPRSGTIDP